ncbi:hypothetical protein MHIP_39530 [Mycolicibacterium hippocampi]|uniref:Uncharacterized protein n=1 Tax=Mycolicibacterium hippocampi TaxID=659824 RepID=A0A7I9ZR07_9MYCO|nr:hypothetical protein MHIP_39530 [Mycolicibacterium hippocampi]
MAAHATVVSSGQGETTASTGAKKNPAPMYHAEPARSQINTTRSHRGMGGAGAAATVADVVTPRFVVIPPRSPAQVSGAIT